MIHEDVLALLADLYEGAREGHWRTAYALAELASGIHFGPEALDAVDETAFLAYLRSAANSEEKTTGPLAPELVAALIRQKAHRDAAARRAELAAADPKGWAP